mgnify:CR=1 FL=1
MRKFCVYLSNGVPSPSYGALAVAAGVSQPVTPIYDALRANAKYPLTADKRKCIEDTARQLLDNEPHAEEPGLLLGCVQGGKTDTFEHIIALCFDRGIDTVVFLTKGTNALAQQTKKRFEQDFAPLKPSNNLNQTATVVIEDIMALRKTGLVKAVVDKSKYIIVCKKETNNLKALIKLYKDLPFLKDKRVLIVDDEADYASRSYKTVKVTKKGQAPKPVTKVAKIGEQINDFRKMLKYNRLLLVTATPYNLFLQPDGSLNLGGKSIKSLRPRFVSIVPMHDQYIGGKQYFVDSDDPNSMYNNLHIPIDQDTIDLLSGGQGNDGEIRFAIGQNLVGTAIRRIQQRDKGIDYKSSMVIHVQIKKVYHQGQADIVNDIMNDFSVHFAGKSLDQNVEKLLQMAYDDIAVSSKKARKQKLTKLRIPTFETVLEEVRAFFANSNYCVRVVNSDNDVDSLLDSDTGELKLDAAINIFVEGNILDRGVTISNMLSFIYGRCPSTFQQDTVTQHQRMFGARPLDDMVVTRFYAHPLIYCRLKAIYGLDEYLREQLANNSPVQILKVRSNMRPCAESKVMASDIIVVKEQTRYYPRGIQTGGARTIGRIVMDIDAQLDAAFNAGKTDADGFIEMKVDDVIRILEKIKSTYVYGPKHKNTEYKLEPEAQMALLKHCSKLSGGKVWVARRTGRNTSRTKQNGVFTNAPDNGTSDLGPARAKAIDKPVVLMIRQEGKQANGWRDTPFYWPVLLTQKTTPSALFATTVKDNLP